MSEPSKEEQFQEDVLDCQDDSDHTVDEEKGSKNIMKPEKGRSMWDLTAEDEEDEDPIKMLAQAVMKLESFKKFAIWFQESAWHEVREVLFSPDCQISDEELRNLLEVKDGDGDNILQVALYKGAPTDIVLRLIEVGGKEVVKAPNRSQQTSLHYACRYDPKFQVVEKLLHGMDQDFISLKDEDDMNALHYACSFLADLDVVKLLLEKGGHELISEIDENGFTSLHFACRAGTDENVVQLLLNEGPEDLVFQQTYQNWSALHHACANNASANIVKMLVNKGGIYLIEMKNKENYTCLYYTCLTSDDPLVLIFLLDTLGQENIQSDEVVNALFLACARGAPAQMIRPFFKGEGITNLSSRRSNNQSILHVACSTQEVKLDTVQELIKLGGKRLVNLQDEDGENVLHYCVRAGVSNEIVEALVNADDFIGSLVRCKNNKKCNVFHLIRSRTPLEVIDHLLRGNNVDQGANIDLCFQSNKNGDLPLDNMINRSELPEKQIFHIQDIMFDNDEDGYLLPFRTLKNIRLLPRPQQELICRGKYIRSALNHLSIKPVAIYPMIFDILFQLLSIWIFSFEVNGNILDIKSEVKYLSYVCCAWNLLHVRTSLVNFMQLSLFGTFIYSLHSELPKESFVTLIIFCIGVTWFRFIYICSIVNYKAKVFISALELITRSLIPFLIVTAFIVMAFAHMFHVLGPPSGIYCPASAMENLEHSEYQAGGWSCQLKDSYFQSFAMLLSGDFLFFEKPNGKWSAITFIFAIVIGIVMLNVLIAVVNDSLVENQRRSQDGFWLGRLDFLCSINDISRFISFRDGFRYEERENIMTILKLLPEHGKLKYKPSRGIFSHWDTRDIDNWKVFDPLCWKLLYWFENGDMPFDDNYDKFPMLTLKQRVLGFFKVAVWNEIIPPSLGMVKVVAGTHRREELKGMRKKFSSELICGLISLSVVLASPIIFALGLLSGGKLWPHKFKKLFLFGPIDAKKHFDSKKKEMQNEIDDLRDEVKNNQAEILALLQEIKKVPVEC
ncbi:hypothetical protein CTEN210_09105 [Chaetoceros tenuissimus]|uniref:Ion transport domain-containing protein n=1 Tax=Chaetoceros tenuissimus TaxID=426638 RepID=A0AAD3CVH2_9STRA|nr:hypothetical protein CTEN210_09105 [Chaetoceros tenuissimus]